MTSSTGPVNAEVAAVLEVYPSMLKPVGELKRSTDQRQE